MDKTTYYMYHIVWNFLISFLLSFPFTALFYGYLFKTITLDIFFVNILSSMSTSLFNITFASFFSNETSGLNFIGLFNMILSIAGSYGIENEWVRSLKKLLPQNFMITYFGDILKTKGDTRDIEYFGTLGVQCIVYLVLFYSLEKFLPNEYGY